MSEEIYRYAYEKLLKDVKGFVINTVLNNVRKPRGYFNGVIDSCAPILELLRASSKELNDALEKEAEKEADYFFAPELLDNDSSDEKH